MEEITSRKNPVVQHMKRLAASRSYRYESREFFCQGEKMFLEAAAANAPVMTVLYCGKTPCELSGVRYVKVPESIIEYISPMQSAPEIVFACKILKKELEMSAKRHYIILENVQDPGNIGTIIRTAAAFDTDVILTGDCADPLGPKAVRASMGAVFRQGFSEIALDELISELKNQGIVLFAAALSDKAADIREIRFGKGMAAAIGSEGRGLSHELLCACDAVFRIPMNKNSESLNAAAAASIIMWEMYRN